MTADSGNGGHGLYRIDLPNDDASRTLLKTCLEVLAFYFTDSVVSLDVGVFNAARIWKVYGTLACKGDHCADRPHRLSQLLNVSTPLAHVTREQMEALAALMPGPPTPPKRGPAAHQPFDIRQWIAAHGVPVVKEEPWQQSGTRWILNPCPWNSDHTNSAAFIVQFANGALAAGCHHNGCQGHDWHALRDLYEPGWQAARGQGPGMRHARTHGPTGREQTRTSADAESQARPAPASALPYDYDQDAEGLWLVEFTKKGEQSDTAHELYRAHPRGYRGRRWHPDPPSVF